VSARRPWIAAVVGALGGLVGSAVAAPGAQLTNVIAVARSEVAHYSAALPASRLAGSSVDSRCFSAASNHLDPKANAQGQPTNPAWYERDALNQYCATLRLRDQFTNPAYGNENLIQGDGLWLQELGEQFQDGPGHLHGGLTTLIPGSQAADSMRTVAEWERRTGGHAIDVAFSSADGAQLRGHVFLPPPGTPSLRNGEHPGVVITDGSIQAYENLYFWAAEGLAQYGYEVLTYDVQGQGDSDLSPAGCPGRGGVNCKGVPYQQDYNFYQGAEDSLSYFLATPATQYHGTYNPGWAVLDHGHVGIAGHSLGAAAVSWVAQCDKRVRAVVAWDDLVPMRVSQCPMNVAVPASDRARAAHAPALALTNDYEFNPQPNFAVPDPNGSANGGGLDGTAGYLSLARDGIDTEIVSIRNGTHLTYSYIPYVLPANEIGERIAF
jgi:alpha-beta hydrolase superfamily lysophospholipase